MSDATENDFDSATSIPPSALSSDKHTNGAKNGSAKNGSKVVSGTNGKSRVQAGEEKNAAESNKNGAEKGDQLVQSDSNETIQKSERVSTAKLEPLGVSVETNLDKAMKILKRKLIKEGLFKELKTRRYFEKPSEKKKRKMKETLKKLRKEESRARKNSMI